MTLATLLLIALKGSLMLLLFAVGLQASSRSGAHLFHQPRQLLRLTLAMNVIVPLVTLVAVRFIDLDAVVEVSLLTLAVSPVSPMLPRKALEAGGDFDYVIGLVVSACLLAVVMVPVSLYVGAAVLHRPPAVPPLRIVLDVMVGLLLPLGAGMFARRRAPALAERFAKPLANVARFVLVMAMIPVLVRAGRPMLELTGHGMLAAFAVFAAVGLVVGHSLGGPRQENRTTLALASASRHPGIAIAIAHSAFPAQTSLGPAVLAYLLVLAFVSAPYLWWVRRRQNASSKREDAHVNVPATHP